MTLAVEYIGKKVKAKMDRPLGSKHPKHGFVYELNYGFVPNTMAGDGEELDVYVLGVDYPVDEFEGMCVAVIHRIDDDDDKLILVPVGMDVADEVIEKQTAFQEKWFNHVIIRG